MHVLNEMTLSLLRVNIIVTILKCKVLMSKPTDSEGTASSLSKK